MKDLKSFLIHKKVLNNETFFGVHIFDTRLEFPMACKDRKMNQDEQKHKSYYKPAECSCHIGGYYLK